MNKTSSSIAIACATGGLKGVFGHGVLSAFEEVGFRAGAYAAASSSVLPAAAAAGGKARKLGLDHWLYGKHRFGRPGFGMSQMVLGGIERDGSWIARDLFRPGNPRFLVAANAVDADGAEETQGKGARRRGRLLLLNAARGQRSWIESHLTLHLFDTLATDETIRLTRENFNEVTYASSRVLHAWDIPAWVAGRPYVDAFYTCSCPAIEMAELGYAMVVAVATEPGLYRDIFQDSVIPDSWQGVPIRIVRPDWDPAEHEVNYTGATVNGLERLYEHGLAKGRAFLADSQKSL